MKKLLTALIATMLVFTMSMMSFAGQWEYDGINWRYIQDNGKYTKGTKEIDGKEYSFDSTGRMLADESTITKYYGPDGVYNPNGPILQTGTYNINGLVTIEYNGVYVTVGAANVPGMNSTTVLVTYSDGEDIQIVFNNNVYNLHKGEYSWKYYWSDDKSMTMWVEGTNHFTFHPKSGNYDITAKYTKTA